MHRFAALFLCALIPLHHGASHAHADIDLQFANMTELDLEDLTFSVDVLLTGSEADPHVTSFGLGAVIEGLTVTSVHNISPLAYHFWEQYEEDDETWLIAGWDGSSGFIDPAPEPTGLFRLDLQVTQASGPFTIEILGLTFRDPEGEILTTGQDSYILTIPAPATLTLMGFGVGGLRRRRGGRGPLSRAG